ncbi:MAG: hypothetical protein N2257_03995 [Thermodesulfovibrionales bacterium]|nr:hypothetical protein [Thermodesulfovibrionales bacterium]
MALKLANIMGRVYTEIANTVTKVEFNDLKNIVAELAEAQKRTEEEIRELVAEHRKTREHLGGLQHTVGYVLEDRAYVGLPALLEKEMGINSLSLLEGIL